MQSVGILKDPALQSTVRLWPLRDLKIPKPPGLSPQQSQEALMASCSTGRGVAPSGPSPNRQTAEAVFLHWLWAQRSKLLCFRRRLPSVRCRWAGPRRPVGRRVQQAPAPSLFLWRRPCLPSRSPRSPGPRGQAAWRAPSAAAALVSGYGQRNNNIIYNM